MLSNPNEAGKAGQQTLIGRAGDNKSANQKYMQHQLQQLLLDCSQNLLSCEATAPALCLVLFSRYDYTVTTLDPF